MRSLLTVLCFGLGACATASDGDDVQVGDDTGNDPVDARELDEPPDAEEGGPTTFTVGGTITGLVGSETITLLNNGGSALTVGNGAFTFATGVAAGSPYAVTVSVAPDHQCTVAMGSGTVTAAVSNVAVSCVSRYLLRESFDALVVPNLPAGWVKAGPRSFDTVSSLSDSAPNSVFVSPIASVSDSSLTLSAFTMPATGTVTLSFRHQYTEESTFDGVVLEVSIGGGAFADIITAGGAFLAGGYNATISVNFSSPIGGRQAWSGSSGAFVSTSVRLPASAAGQTVALRWRQGTDTSSAGTGYWLDTIAARID